MEARKLSASGPPSGRVSSPGPGTGDDGPVRVLVIDDVPEVLRAFQRTLSVEGYVVDTLDSARSAVAQIRARSYHAVLTDISMPDMDGLQLLREIREQDLEVPVILVTGDPSVETAIPAVEYGALSYLVKPVAAEVLRKKVEWAVQMRRLSQVKEEALQLLSRAASAAEDEAGLGARFDCALSRLEMHYQPIVRWSDRSILGYEALVRSGEPELATPGPLFQAAERLGRELDLTRAIRALAQAPFTGGAAGPRLFLNLHVLDLDDDTLCDPASPLVQIAPQVTLEITERASLERVRGVRGRIRALRALGFRIAIDDLGAGYAGLSSFALLEPDTVKLDMALVRDVHESATKQRLVRSMAQLCAEMALEFVAEGVETESERDMLVSLGCDLLQGHIFARPTPLLEPVVW